MEQDNNNKKKTSNKKMAKVNKVINITLWSCFFLGIFIVISIFFAIGKGHIGYVPDIEQLENPIDHYASQVISEDGLILGSYNISKENRIFVNYKDLSPELVQALIATEDNRFSSHSGIDIKGLVRAVIKRGLLMQKSGGGGSTITQQLAKQLFSPRAENITERILQKPIEWVIAVQIGRAHV